MNRFVIIFLKPLRLEIANPYLSVLNGVTILESLMNHLKVQIEKCMQLSLNTIVLTTEDKESNYILIMAENKLA